MTEYDKLQEYLRCNQHTWLITGVSGFIGSNLLEKLLILNQKVIGLDNFETGYQLNLDQAIAEAENSTGKSLSANFNFINGDIRYFEDCKKACKDVNYVLHQAALGSVPRSIDDPISSNETNIDGFLNILVAARDAKVQRFVYAASSSTYGDNPVQLKVENEIGSPFSPYAVTKLVNELYAQVFAQNYNFKTIGLRYFNIFGKRQDPNGSYAAVIPKWVSEIMAKEDVFINGDGETTRDFCHVDDTVQMNLLAASTEIESATNQIYNVALGNRTSLNQLYQMIEKGLIQRIEGLDKKDPIYKAFRDGDIRHSQADISKAIRHLHYSPIHKIEQGLDKSLDWYIENL